jgi:ABC-type lipoprotein export system ATPase subunit
MGEILQIQLTNVSIHLPDRQKPLFHIPSLKLGPGEKLLLRGPSGAGKTTLLHLIAGLLAPSEGSVLVNEQNLRFLSDNQRCQLRRSRMGLIFQTLNLLDHLTALENVQLVLSGPSQRDRAMDALSQMQLTSVPDRLTAVLSLGEQQRVAVARVLAQKPEVILADEPTSSLDDANATVVIQSLLSLPHQPTCIVVSHDHRLPRHFSSVIDFTQWAVA